MLIAYYTYGNIQNPIGKIHNEKGDLILEQDEIQLSKDEGVRCVIYKGRFFPKIIFRNTGKGVLFRTSDRIVFIREPNPKECMKIRNLEMATDLALQSKQWKREGKKECFSLPLDEIQKIKRTSYGQSMKIKGDDGWFIVLISGKGVNRF